MEDLERILVDIGYTLIDRGNEYRTNALYRGGDNSTSLCISKKDGRWYDFKERVGGRFEELVKLTLGIDKAGVEKILADKNLSSPVTIIKSPADRESKTKVFKKEQLGTLVRDHSYWESRGVKKETIKIFDIEIKIINSPSSFATIFICSSD